jgi:RNA polymerase sigma-70 factor, ECF subfamily
MQDRFTSDLISLLPNLRRFALSLSRRPDLADDLVQTTAERAFAARDRFDPTTRLDAWLFRILRNAWLDTVRRQQTRGTEVEMENVADAVVTDGVATVETQIMLKSAEAAVAALPIEQREVMMLICVEEMTYKETAEVLGLPIGTVMSRLARARVAVANRLGIK